MLNTQKLLYILPDVAFIAELLPGKKPTTYKIQNFHQVNGEFMDDNEFIGENLQKLFGKIDAEEYQLILPDFLFTNTIVNIKEASDSKIKSYLAEKLLPELGITTDSHDTDTTILTEHGGSSRVQLSAIERSVLEPLQISAGESGIKIAGISPLSWTVKSLISLEPSISVLQIGENLFTALHYIGIDQTSQAPVAEVDAVFETIKTLKGGEPSIQTVYLLSDSDVEKSLKTKLSDTLPIQQLAQGSDDDEMPAFIRMMIEAGMRTLSIEDYPTPSFALGKAPAGATIQAKSSSQDETEEEEMSSDLPTPNKKEALQADEPQIEEEEPTMKEDEVETQEEEKAVESESMSAEEKPETEKPEVEESVEIEEKAVEPEPTTPEKKDDDQIEELLNTLKSDQPAQKENMSENQPMEKEPKKVIKNKDKTRTMMKMVFVTLAVFFATVGVGIGIGLGVLQLTQGEKSNNADTPVAEASPEPSPSPSPSPEPAIVREDLSVLVVNATTTPGYAGETADKLSDAGYGTVDAGNAAGEYEEGFYVLMAEEDLSLISALEEDTGLSLTYQADVEVEDSTDEYDAVIVLAE